MSVYILEFWLSLWKIVRSSVISLLPLFRDFQKLSNQKQELTGGFNFLETDQPQTKIAYGGHIC
jgi:hypothetical protein